MQQQQLLCIDSKIFKLKLKISNNVVNCFITRTQLYKWHYHNGYKFRRINEFVHNVKCGKVIKLQVIFGPEFICSMCVWRLVHMHTIYIHIAFIYSTPSWFYQLGIRMLLFAYFCSVVAAVSLSLSFSIFFVRSICK